MKRIKVGTITLALGLIGLGIILFANNFMNIGLTDLYKYWPVLVIGLGIEMIIFAIIYHRDGEAKLRIDALCLVFIIVAGIVCSNITGFSFGPKLSFNLFEGNMMIDGIKYKGELKETWVKDNVSKDFDISKLTARNSFGDVRLLPYDQQYIKVEAQIKVKYNDEQAAKAYAKDAIRITEGQQTQVSVVEYSLADKNKFAKANIDFVIYVPKDVYADVYCSFGDIHAEGISQGMTASNQHGDVTVQDITGDVIVRNSFGEIEIKNISGKTQAENQHGDIDVEFIGKDAQVETSFGDIEASDIGGSINVKNNYGKIGVKNVKGDAQVRTSFGDVETAYIEGNSTINNNNGAIEATELKGNVQIRNSFGRIEYSSSNTANADIYAKTSFGNIETNLPINVKKSVNDFTAEGKTGEGKYRIDLMTNNGEIQIK